MPKKIFNIVTNRGEFFRQLDLAIARTQKFMVQSPTSSLLPPVARQLDAIKQWTLNTRKPTFDERKSIDMGTRAQRELQGTTEMEWYDYMQQLTELDLYFKYWRSDAGLLTLDPNDWRVAFPEDQDLSDE